MTRESKTLNILKCVAAVFVILAALSFFTGCSSTLGGYAPATVNDLAQTRTTLANEITETRITLAELATATAPASPVAHKAAYEADQKLGQVPQSDVNNLIEIFGGIAGTLLLGGGVYHRKKINNLKDVARKVAPMPTHEAHVELAKHS
jgi:hypothetical protein